MWKGGEKKARVKWAVLVLAEEEGGIGLKDPICALDAAKMRMFITLATKDRQPWMRWVERKLKKVGERWGAEEGALEASPNLKQRRELKDDCLVESALKIWFEIGGGARERKEENEEDDEKKNQGHKTEEDKKTKRDRKRTKKEIGVEIEGEWRPITTLTTKHAYNQLKAKRLKVGKYKPKQAHRNISIIQDRLTADERDYWWRLTHRLISLRKTESKWKRQESGELVKNTCPVCKEAVEDEAHYNYDCSAIQGFMEHVAKSTRGSGPISREEWSLEKKGMEEKQMILIAKARWVYHCERCKIDIRRRKRVVIKVLMNRLERRM